MVAAVKFQDFVEQLGLKGHNLNTDTFNIALTNTLPVNTQTWLVSYATQEGAPQTLL